MIQLAELHHRIALEHLLAVDRRCDDHRHPYADRQVRPHLRHCFSRGDAVDQEQASSPGALLACVCPPSLAPRAHRVQWSDHWLCLGRPALSPAPPGSGPSASHPPFGRGRIGKRTNESAYFRARAVLPTPSRPVTSTRPPSLHTASIASSSCCRPVKCTGGRMITSHFSCFSCHPAPPLVHF